MSNDFVPYKINERPNYPDQKAYAEGCGELRFITESPVRIGYIINGKPHAVTEHQFKKDFGEAKEFVKKWLNDKKKRRADKVVDIPFSSKRQKIGPRDFNLFNGFLNTTKKVLSEREREECQKVMDKWKDIVLQLCEGNQKLFNLYLAWISNMLRFPTCCNPSAYVWVFVDSIQGVGKDVHILPLLKILDTYAISASRLRDYVANPNMRVKKVLCVVTELGTKDSKKYETTLRGFSGTNKIAISRSKGSYSVDNWNHFILFSNHTDLYFDVANGDRRFVFAKPTSTYKDGPKYTSEWWNNLAERFKDPDFLNYFLEYFTNPKMCGVDVEKFDWKSKRKEALTRTYTYCVHRLLEPIKRFTLALCEGKLKPSADADRLEGDEVTLTSTIVSGWYNEFLSNDPRNNDATPEERRKYRLNTQQVFKAVQDIIERNGGKIEESSKDHTKILRFKRTEAATALNNRWGLKDG